ncbi:glycoside hydrolase family 13 protein [Virgibacillus litoralis]|uniref:oligo-1,6-glucosidase n=1 Tax=Virgibacillus litoralis TaxID=578221 RepID=A0ABS4HAX4_9BACI|nr:alpha-glucosidase [Virgibacillus litoralis]MBP1948057.1 oligo-1,6-glucosidase [Virgibacillus litoralis]
MTRQWWKESVVYQIYPRSFNDSNNDGIGDINGIIQKLDYLKDLGIDVIWLSPVYESPNDDNGYDISDYTRIMSDFGTMEDWNRMLHEIHKRDMKLIMDLVINHTSDEHNWFIESRKSTDNAFRDYYIWRDKPNNWESAFSGSAWKYDKTTNQYYLHLFSQKQPDLNWENPDVRNDLYTMMQWWIDKGVDGFRMDVINFISKDQRLPDGEANNGNLYASGHPYYMNGPRVHEFLQEMNQKTLANYDTMTVGEMPGVTPEQAKLYTAESRNELDMVFHFEHMDIDSGLSGKWDIKPWSLVELKQILSKWQTELENEGWNSLYWNNHDQPRVVSRFGDDGNYRVESAKMLATTLHMMKGTPYIYQGEELGMTNVRFSQIASYRDIETLNMYEEKINEGAEEKAVLETIHAKSRDNARTPMQWDTSVNAGFSKTTPWLQVNPNYVDINAAKAVADPDSIYHYYRQLIALRKNYPIIVYGAYELLMAESEKIFAYTRKLGNTSLLVVSNFTNDFIHFEIPKDFLKASKIIGNYHEPNKRSGQRLELKPYESCVYYDADS